MSKCHNCGFRFEEENGWQEFCSMECAMETFGGKVFTTEDFVKAMDTSDQTKETKNLRKKIKSWNDFWGKECNKRLVRQGPRAKKPVIGVWEEVKVLTPEGIVTRKINVGGGIVIRPITEEEQITIIKRRGRSWLPSNLGGALVPPSVLNNPGFGWFKHD